ncbi:Sec1-like, domain 2 [Phytophthora cactorum]|nr:Sec1-like, domain 2 [Phytophthora cactorum]
MELETALKADALAAFARSIEVALGPATTSRGKVILAVDASQLAIFELLAYGSGGSEHLEGPTGQSGAGKEGAGRGRGGPAITHRGQALADALRPLELVATRRCAVLWLPAATSDVALEMERQGVAGFIRQANLGLGLIPVDRGVAALCHDSVFGELYVKGDSRALTDVVKSVLAVEKHTGRRILDVTCHGFFAQRVKKMLELAHRQQQKIKMNRVAGVKEGEADVATAMDKLVVIDRMEDPLSMLLTPMTYEGLLDALVGVNHGVVTYEKEDEETEEAPTDRGPSSTSSSKTGSTSTTTQKVVLNHLDALFDEIRDVNFNLVSNQLVDVAKDLATEVRGSSAGSTAGLPKDSQAEFQKVKALLAKAPHLVKKKRSLAHHLQLVQRIRELTKDVDNFLEEAILREPPLNLYDVVKLLCLCSLVRGGLKPDTLAWYRQQLCHTYGHQILPLLVQLEKMDLLSVENRFDFPKMRKQLLLMRGALDDEDTRHPTDIHFMFPYTGYAPMSIRLLQDSLGMKYKTLAKDPTSSLLSLGSNNSSSHHSMSDSSSSLDNSNGGRRINVLVYYVGGVTVAELTAFRFLNQKQSEYTFFIAATSICNGSRLLRAIY